MLGSARTLLKEHVVLLVVVALLIAPLLLLAATQRDRPQRRTAQGDLALVAATSVRPRVTEVALPGREALIRSRGTQARTGSATRDNLDVPASVTSQPQAVQGYATIGVTWDFNPAERHGDVVVLARTRDRGAWSPWVNFDYDAEHGPDPGSPDETLRAGTDPFPVGTVEQVQVRVVMTGGRPLPRGLRLSIVDPGDAAVERREGPALAAPDSATADAVAASSTNRGATARPAMFSRAQWGADEDLRDRGSLSYGRVTMGFVHHTVNGNDYTRDQVPALLRGIYAYHTQSKGWSDIGYNFVVDRFGRIWEGRYGGVGRAVTGAHTLGYNDVAFAASALGNFETTTPSAAMIGAFSRLFAWKLSLHGVDPMGRVRVGSDVLDAISGHRDAGTTACPGRNLYGRLSIIRERAAAAQHPYVPRDRDTDLLGSAWPDLALRDAATGRLAVLRTGGQVGYRAGRRLAFDWRDKDLIAAVGDVTSDRVPDLVARSRASGAAYVYPGRAGGSLGEPRRAPSSFAGLDQLTGVRDLTGDRRADVVGRVRATDRLLLYPGDGQGGFRTPIKLAEDWGRYDLTAGVGDMDGDGFNDVVARSGNDLLLFPGRLRGLRSPVRLPGSWGAYDVINGLGDLANDGVMDLVAKRRDTQLAYIFRGNARGGLSRALGPFRAFSNATFLAGGGNWGGTRHSDIIVRGPRGALRVFINSGGRNAAPIVTTGIRLDDIDRILNVGDWNGDGRGDLITRRRSTGGLQLRAGSVDGDFRSPVPMGRRAQGLRLVAVGDLTGDGFPDLVSQDPDGVRRVLPSDGANAFARSFELGSAASNVSFVGVGRWDRDGAPDLFDLVDGTPTLRRGNGPAYLFARGSVTGQLQGFSKVYGVGDLDGDRRPDLVGRKVKAGELWMIPAAGMRLGQPRLIVDGLGGYDLIG